MQLQTTESEMIRRRTAFAGSRIYGNSMRMANTKAQRRKRRPVAIPINWNSNISNKVTRALGFRGRGGGSIVKYSGGNAFNAQQIKPGMGASFSYFRRTSKPHPKAYAIKKTGAQQVYEYVSSLRLTGTTGVQCYTSFSSGLGSDLNAMALLVPSYNNTTQLILERMTADFSFTNQNETTVFLDFYQITPRYTASNATISPTTSADNGLLDMSGSTRTFTSLGAVPTDSKQFTAFFSISKKYTIELAQGQSHMHKTSFTLNQKYIKELFNVMGSTYLPNMTKIFMVVGRGVPINDQTTKTNVSTSSVAVDIVRNERYYWNYINPTTSTYTFTSALPAITTEYVLDIGSGEPETVQAA